MASIPTAREDIDLETTLDLDKLVKDKGKAKEPKIPTYEDATGVLDASRLPSYRTRSLRYYPYGRPTATFSSDVYDQPHPADRFFNTVYDDEYILLEVPPRRPSSSASRNGSAVQEGPSNTSHQNFAQMFQQIVMNEVPAAPTPGADVIAQINRQHEVDAQDLAYALEDVQAQDMQMQNLAAAILREFVAGLLRARHE